MSFPSLLLNLYSSKRAQIHSPAIIEHRFTAQKYTVTENGSKWIWTTILPNTMFGRSYRFELMDPLTQEKINSNVACFGKNKPYYWTNSKMLALFSLHFGSSLQKNSKKYIYIYIVKIFINFMKKILKNLWIIIELLFFSHKKFN